MSEKAASVDGAALSGREREVYVGGLFQRIAGPYDRLNGLISLGRDQAWRRAAIRLAGVGPGSRVLDLGCGTGDFLLAALPALQGRGDLVGIDLAPAMIERAREKIGAPPGVRVELRCGNACETGVADGWADVVTMGWVVRNLGDRARAYAEILRVLKPAGRFVCLEVSRPSSAIMRGGFAVYMRAVMPLLVRLCGGDARAYRYLTDSTAKFLGAEALATELWDAGFADVSYRTLMGGAMAIHRVLKRG
jgi:demethylmenaquinone methyltransferase/2-methoxy-6-polyprenyl-1,4-benzoquinol methylase